MRTRLLYSVAIVSACVTFGLGGCGTPSQMGTPILLATQGPVAVDVVSFSGDVTVNADPSLPWATIAVRRRATHGIRRNEEAQDSLANIQYSARIVEGEHGPVLQVRIWTTDKEPWFQRADVVINLPRVRGLTVRTTNGMIEALNIDGEIDIECSNGDVRVMTNLRMRRAVTIHNDRGNIDYRVPYGSTAAFACHSTGGSVDGRIRQGRYIVHAGTDHATLVATLNEGTNPVKLTTTEGDIRIAVVEKPTDVGSFIVTP